MGAEPGLPLEQPLPILSWAVPPPEPCFWRNLPVPIVTLRFYVITFEASAQVRLGAGVTDGGVNLWRRRDGQIGQGVEPGEGDAFAGHPSRERKA